MKRNNKLAYLFSCFLIIGYFGFSQQMEFKKSKEGILLMEDGNPRFFYRIAVDSARQYARGNYVHPLYGLDGEILTEDFPEDHLHHHGIFWAWHQLYAEGKRMGDTWLNEGLRWDISNVKPIISGKTAKLTAEILWIRTLDESSILKENLAIHFKRMDKDVFALTFDISLTALVDSVAIGGSEDQKGYGGFSARVILPEDVTFNSNTEEIEPQNLAVQAGPWINIEGNFDPSSKTSSGIVLMGEPKKLPSYHGWILRKAQSMQNMAFPGRNPIPIKKGEPIKFRNQILVHRDLSKEEISKYYKKFAER